MTVIPFPGTQTTMRVLGPRNGVMSVRSLTETIREQDGSLADILDYWRSLRGPSKIPPPRKAVDVVALKPVMGYAHVVDCSDEDPMNYRFRLFGSRILLFGGKDFTKQRVADLPDPELARTTAADYRDVVFKGCPAFHKIVTRLDFRKASYTRLLLPLANDQRQINQLLVCVNPRPLPELGELPW